MKLFCLTILIQIFTASTVTAEELITKEDDPTIMPTAYLLIEPVTCRSDSGTNPAVDRLHRDAIEMIYAQAGIEIAWLEPSYFNSSDVRDGTIDPDSAVMVGINQRIWGSGPPRISLVLVNAIKGTTGPRGLGMQSGSICFVAMTELESNPNREVFVIAHEIGHCLNLIHTVDDSCIANDIPCIMGGGTFADRTGEGALQPSHIVTVRNNPLLLLKNDHATTCNQLNNYLQSP